MPHRRILTGPERARLSDALLSAFPREIDLERLVDLAFHRKLDHIVGPGDLSTRVFQLIERAEARGRLARLSEVARRANPGNEALKACLTSLPADIVGKVSDDELNAETPPDAPSSRKTRRGHVVTGIAVAVALVASAMVMPSFRDWNTSPRTRVLSGTVVDERDTPIAGATVSIDERTEAVDTTASGSFSLVLSADAPNQVQLRVRKKDYHDWSQPVSGSAVPQRIHLVKAPFIVDVTVDRPDRASPER